MIKVLFLSSNPKGTGRLQLTKECNNIEDRISSSRYSSQFDFRQRNDANLEDLQRFILTHNPQILHFSGHGTEDGTLVFQDLRGKPKTARITAIADSLKALNKRTSLSEKEKIRLVVLNACYSREQAKAIAKYVDCVVGMSNAVYDTSAIAFAESFYQALAFGESVFDAFELARNQVEILNLEGQDIPKLASKSGVDPSKLFLVKKDRSDVSSEGLKALGRMFDKLDVIYAQRMPKMRTRGVSKGPRLRAKKEGNAIRIRRGEQVVETIAADDFERKLGPQNLQLIRMKEASMNNYFSVYTSVYPQLSIEVNPVTKAKLDLQLKQALDGMCSDWRNIVAFLNSCGFRLEDHYQHASFLCGR